MHNCRVCRYRTIKARYKHLRKRQTVDGERDFGALWQTPSLRPVKTETRSPSRNDEVSIGLAGFRRHRLTLLVPCSTLTSVSELETSFFPLSLRIKTSKHAARMEMVVAAGEG